MGKFLSRQERLLRVYLSSAARLGLRQELASPAILIHFLSKMNEAGFIEIQEALTGRNGLR